jgi:hypothetical protein
MEDETQGRGRIRESISTVSNHDAIDSRNDELERGVGDQPPMFWPRILAQDVARRANEKFAIIETHCETHVNRVMVGKIDPFDSTHSRNRSTSAHQAQPSWFLMRHIGLLDHHWRTSRRHRRYR